MSEEIKKESKQKIILWEGFRKELPWILFWILIGVMSYGYYQDKQICEEVLSNPCKVCYSLNQTQINYEYIIPNNIYENITINDSLISKGDKELTSRTISNYGEW